MGATSTVTLADTDELALTDGGIIVVTGTGSVALLYSTFGAGTYTAAGAVTIASATAGNTIETSTTADEGLILGADDTALSLLGQGTTGATYTFVKAESGEGVVFGNGTDAVTVGNGSTSGTSSLTASATAKIVLGTTSNATDAIRLGNGSTLVLTTGATLSGAALTKDSASLVNDGGTLTATDADATLTGANGGASSITAAADFEEETAD